jgi:Lon protease-like protein
MIGEVIESQQEFGVVLASDKGIVNTGCTAVVEKVLKTYDDGRMDVIVVGRRRFEIVLLNEDKSYLRGAVEFFDDEEFEQIPPGVKERVLEGYNDLCQIDPQEQAIDPELTDPQLSFQLAQVLSDLNFRQMLLATRSESERMKRLADFLPAFNSRQRQVAHVRAVAPNNGHGKWPPSL